VIHPYGLMPLICLGHPALRSRLSQRWLLEPGAVRILWQFVRTAQMARSTSSRRSQWCMSSPADDSPATSQCVSLFARVQPV